VFFSFKLLGRRPTTRDCFCFGRDSCVSSVSPFLSVSLWVLFAPLFVGLGFVSVLFSTVRFVLGWRPKTLGFSCFSLGSCTTLLLSLSFWIFSVLLLSGSNPKTPETWFFSFGGGACVGSPSYSSSSRDTDSDRLYFTWIFLVFFYLIERFLLSGPAPPFFTGGHGSAFLKGSWCLGGFGGGEGGVGVLGVAGRGGFTGCGSRAVIITTSRGCVGGFGAGGGVWGCGSLTVINATRHNVSCCRLFRENGVRLLIPTELPVSTGRRSGSWLGALRDAASCYISLGRGSCCRGGEVGVRGGNCNH
jgi:hypothetical protein